MKKLIYALPLVLALGACSNEESVTAPVETEDSGIYLTLTASLPSTRSTTTTDGASSDNTLAGSANESAITSATVYFYTEASGSLTLAHSETFSGSEISGTETFKLKKSISETNLGNLLNKDLKVFVVANGSSVGALGGTTPTDWTFAASTAGVSPIKDFGNGGATMTFVNHAAASINTTGVSSIYSLLKQEGNDQIFDLTNGSGEVSQGTGEINLERTLARIDFKPNASNGDKYELQGSVKNYKLELTKMQIINSNTGNEYLFRHTLEGTTASAFGTPANSVQLFGEEGSKGSGYVWVAGKDWPTTADGVSTWNPTRTNTLTVSGGTYTITGNTGTIDLSTLKNAQRTYDANTGIYSWGYVLESPLPARTLMDESNLYKNATGVAFTFRVCETNGTPVAQNGTLRIMMDGGTYQDVNYTTDGYYLTYFGFIKHNDAANAAMEYSIVRNNVYQLSIGTISTLPDPTQISTMYLQLNVKVLPWVLRMNEFSWTE